MLRQRLVTEHGPAVLAWLVEGARLWHRDGLGEAEAVTAATTNYRRAEDTFGAWLAECTIAVEIRTKVGDLWDSWKAWCDQARERPGRKQEFSRSLEEHGIAIETYKGTRLTRGIGVRRGSHEVSSRTSPISTPVGTLGVRPHETSSSQVGPLPLTDEALESVFS